MRLHENKAEGQALGHRRVHRVTGCFSGWPPSHRRGISYTGVKSLSKEN